MEASGGYERRAFIEAVGAGCQPAHSTNPRSVRRYAEAMGILEKTDRIDASVIARFAEARGMAPTPLPSQPQQRLKALVARLRQVTDDLTVQKQRRSSMLDNAEMQASVDEVIALLEAPVPHPRRRDRFHDRRRPTVVAARRCMALE